MKHQAILQKLFRTLGGSLPVVAVFMLAWTAFATPYNTTAFWKQPSTAAYKLAFTTSAFTVSTTWTCTGVMTVQSQTQAGAVQNVAADTTVNLSGATGIRFFSDSSCTSEITSVVITSGTSSANYYFLSGKTGTLAINAAATGYTGAAQNQTVSGYLGCTWLGTTSTAWTTTTNWSCGHVPTTSFGDIAIFDSNCVSARCSPAVNTTATGNAAYGLWLTKDYTGTVTTTSTATRSLAISAGGLCRVDGGTLQLGSRPFTCSGEYRQTGGIFNGGTSTTTFANHIKISGGTFTTPSVTFSGANTGKYLTISGGTVIQAGIIQTDGSFIMSGGTFTGGTQSFTVAAFTLSGGSFTATSGTFFTTGTFTVSGSPTFDANGGTFSFGSVGTTSLTPSTVTYNDVKFIGAGGSFSLTGTMTVAGDLTLNETSGYNSWGGYSINGGTINVGGDIESKGYGLGGTVAIRATGNAAGQTITSTDDVVAGYGGAIPNLEIVAGTNPVTLGTYVSVIGNYRVTSVGTFTIGTGSVLVYGVGASVLRPGAHDYNNFTISGYFPVYNMNAQTLNVYGTLTLAPNSYNAEAINSGFLRAYGDVFVNNQGFPDSTATLTLMGKSSGQTITGQGGVIPATTLATGTNPVTFSGDMAFKGSFTNNGTGSFVTLGTNIAFRGTDLGAATLNTGSIRFNNVYIYGNAATYSLAAGTMYVDGTFTFGDVSYYDYYLNNGTIEVKGNISVKDFGFIGSATIKAVSGAAGQTISTVATGHIPNLEIAAGSNDVTLSGTNRIYANYTMTSVGTFTVTSSTLWFAGTYQSTSYVYPGTVSYNNVTFGGSNGGIGSNSSYDLGGATFKVGGNLTLNETNYIGEINNGSLEVGGDLTATNYGKSGTATLRFVGTSPSVSVASAATNLPAGLVTVAVSGTVVFATNVSWNATGQSLSITSGAINMNNHDLTIKNTLTLSGGTSITRGTGVLRVNGSTIGAGAYSGGTIN